jgi:hypothetical protein
MGFNTHDNCGNDSTRLDFCLQHQKLRASGRTVMREKLLDRVTWYQAQYDSLDADDPLRILIGDALQRAGDTLEKHDAEQAKIDRLGR